MPKWFVWNPNAPLTWSGRSPRPNMGWLLGGSCSSWGWARSGSRRGCGVGGWCACAAAVYALGQRVLTQHGRWMAAVLACGEGALLSHRSAAALWGLRPPGGSLIEATTGVSGVRAREDGIRAASVDDRCPAVRDGARGDPGDDGRLDALGPRRGASARRSCAAPSRPPSNCELFDLTRINAALAADPGRPGSRKLLALLDDMKDHGVTRTRSEVEALLLQLCLDHGLPRPRSTAMTTAARSTSAGHATA